MFKFLGRLRTVFMAKIMSWVQFPDGVPIAKFTDYESYLKAGTGLIWATWKAIDLIAQATSDTAWACYKKGTNKKTEPADLLALLKTPNQFETFAELLYKIIFHVRLTGNAFMVKDQCNVKFDRPKQLFLLNPKNVKIVPDKDDKISGYIWNAGPGVSIPFEPGEIAHFKRPHANSDYWGLGDIEAGEPLFEEYLNRQTWAKNFWKNGAAPSSILICEDLITDKLQWEEAKAKWQKEYGGTNNSGKTAWLTGKWRAEKLGLTAVEMQDLEKVKHTEESIFHMHGVPLSVAGVKEAANYATAEIDEMIFRRYAVAPMVKLIEDTLQSDLVNGFNPNVELKFAISGLLNIAQLVLDNAQLFDRGIISINEFRLKVGLEPDPDNPMWDQHFINAGLIPLELSGLAQQDAASAAAEQVAQRFIATALERKRLPGPPATANNGT